MRDLNTEYLLGTHEKKQAEKKPGEEGALAPALEPAAKDSQELIDIVFMENGSEPKSELSKITEVEYSYKQFSQDKHTNSFLNSNFENDKTTEHVNQTSKKSSVEVPASSVFRRSTPFLQASSKSINLTKSNNVSVIENLNYSLDEPHPNSPVAVKRVTKIKLRPVEHKPKSRSLDIQCLNHLRTSQEEELAKYRKYKTLLSNVKSHQIAVKKDEPAPRLLERVK